MSLSKLPAAAAHRSLPTFMPPASPTAIANQPSAHTHICFLNAHPFP
jgi:hypothetical protein